MAMTMVPVGLLASDAHAALLDRRKVSRKATPVAAAPPRAMTARPPRVPRASSGPAGHQRPARGQRSQRRAAETPIATFRPTRTGSVAQGRSVHARRSRVGAQTAMSRRPGTRMVTARSQDRGRSAHVRRLPRRRRPPIRRLRGAAAPARNRIASRPVRLRVAPRVVREAAMGVVARNVVRSASVVRSTSS